MMPGRTTFQGHVMTSGDFLATWAVKLTVHLTDLELEHAPALTGCSLTRATIEASAGRRLPISWSDADVIAVGTGRRAPNDTESGELGDVARRLPVFG